MNNKKIVSKDKAYMQDHLEPRDKLLVTQSTVQITTDIVAEYAKTQTGNQLKSVEMEIEALWKTLVILNKYEGYFENPDNKTIKALSKPKANWLDLAERPKCHKMSTLLIEYLSNQMNEWSNEFPERSESLQSDAKVLWKTLLVLNKAKASFKGLNDKYIKSLTDKAAAQGL